LFLKAKRGTLSDLSERVSPNTFGLALALPAVLAVLLIVVYPLLYNVRLSFYDIKLLGSAKSTFVGLGNYVRIFGSPSFWTALMNTLRFALLAVGAQLLLGFAMALIFNSLTNSVGFIRSLLSTPVMIAPVVIALQWRWMYSEQYGILNYFLNLLGLESVQWLSSPVVAPYSLILVDTWQNFPFVMMILLAGLQSLPTDPYDAARVDGASWLQTLRYITLPLLRPVLLVAIIVRTTDVFRIFDTVYVLTGGGPGNASEVLGTLTYRQTFTFINFGTGAALSIISLIVCCVIGMLSIKLFKPAD
jgi:multiple sugar transport system permease protein